MGKFDGVLDEVYGKQNTKLTSVLDEVYGPEVEPVTMVENEPTPIADMMVGLNRGIESAGEAIASPIRRLFTAPPNQDVIVPEELDLGSMQAVRDRQAMLPPSMPAEPGYVPPAGITEGLKAAFPIAYQATKKGISGAVQALAENAPVTSFPTAPIAEYMQGVGEGAQAEIEKIIQEKQIRPGTISGVATDVGATVLQFAPILGASIISPTLAPYGLGLLATISGGDKYQKAKQAGFTEEQALAQGIAYGIAEVVGEKIGLDALLNAYKNPALRQGIMGFIKETAKQAGIGAGEEGLTQIMQNSVDIAAKKFNPYTAGQAPALTQDVLYSAGVGAIGQGIIGGVLGALQSVMAGQQQPQTEAPKEEVQPEEPIRESTTSTEPPPQNMEATTEFLTRKPVVTFGEAERLRGEEVPTGGMTINRQARPTVTLGGEGERTGEAIPEGQGMTVQPTAPTNKLDQLFKREPSKPSPQPQQATEVAPKDITPQPAEPTAVKAPEIEKGIKPSQKTFEMDTEYINADPKRFQYKTGTDAEGVTDLYKDVPFDEKQAGILTVWKDKDGKYYVIDGHHRLEMAKRSKVPTVDVRIANDYGINTEKEARLFGALKNISDGRGTAFDAAKIFKELNIDKLGDVKDFKINKKTAVAKQGFALSKLSDLVWEAARNNFIPEDIAAQLSVLDHTKQNSVYKLLAQRKKKTGEFPDKKTVSELADSVSTMDEGSFGETDMFGNIVETEPLIERSNIISYVQDSLKEEKKTFKIGSNKELAERLATSQIGQLNKEKGAELLNKTLTTIEVFDNMKNIKGSKVADILNDSARKMAEGGNPNLIKQEALKNVKTAIETEYSKYYEGDKPSSERGKTTPDVREEVEEDLFEQPRPKSGPGMFGGATVQNMYEEIAPKVKKGLDIFTKKAKEFIADEEGFYSPEELANAVKAVKDKFIGKIKRGQSTQVTNTINTYAKILDRIADKAQGKTGDVRIVDVSTGLGMSEELAKNLGYKKYETTEPFPAEGFVPTYKDSTQLPDNAFDFITNNQVLNVVPKEIRDGIVKDIGRALKEGGTAIISTRGKDVMAATTGRAGEEPMSLYIPAKDAQGKSYEQYQKGFTNAELKDYVQGLLGDGFDVKTAPFGAAGVEIVKTKKTTPKIGMLGAGTLQNAYEKVEPTLKKGADMLFKKGKQAYETVKRNADLTRDMGRVVDITEKEGRPVETEPPIRPRIGMFGAGTIQDIYEKIVGKKQTSNEKITIGDPNIAKKIDDAYDATDKIEMDTKKDAEKMRQTVGGAARQSMIDLFAPYLDLVKKDPARYEQALKKLHDVFYIPSEVEGFLNDYRDQILAPIKKAGKTYRDYSAYRMAKWTLTGRAKVKSKLTLPEAQQFIDSIDPQTRKIFEDITTNFHEKTWKPLLKLLEDAGLKDDKVINFIMDKENYSPFFPAKQMGLSYGSREYKPSGEIFKLTEKGYEGDIQDVLTSLMQKGIAMLTHANINMAKLEGIDILKTMAPKSITKAKQSFKGVKKLKDSNGNEIEMPIMEFDEPASNSQMALLTVREDGKAKGYYVPKQFAEAFDNALGDPSSFADSLRYYSNLTQAIKNVWIDYNPPWQLFTNMVRDIPAAAIEMPGFKKPVKFLGKVIKKAPAAIGDYVKFIGEVGQQITGYDRKAFEKQVTQLLKEKKLLSSKDVQHLGDYNITVFDRIQNAFDTFPKEGESQGFLQQLKAFGKDVERLTKVAFDETLQESGEFTQDEIKNMTRRGGSPAFGVRGGGKAFEAIKVPLMFYNAVKEGWRAGKYFYQKDPAGFLIKASVPLSIFSFGAAAAAGAFGDEWKKAYLAIKKSDRENKLVYPLWWTDEGNIKYLALSVPQFLKPFMIMINELASSNPSLAEGLADAMSNEMPSLNPVLDITKTLTSYGGNKPPIDRFGNPIMTQDQWTAGGSEKAIAMLKSISNQNLFGSYFKFPIKPSDKKKDWLETFYDASFGKIMKESFAPTIDTEEQDVNAAKARLLARQIIEIEKENPEEANRLRDEMRKLGYTPSRQFMRSVRRETNIEREKEAGTITDREAYEKRLRQQPKTKRKKYNELFKK